jgi:hypothetical protein
MTIKLHIEIDGLTHDVDFKGSTAELEAILRPIGELSKSDPSREVEEAWIRIRRSPAPSLHESAVVATIANSLQTPPA